MNKKYLLPLLFCFSLTFCGGLVDAYTFVFRNGLFANMQTGNLVKLGIAIANGSFDLMLFLPIVCFILGCIVASLLKKIKNYNLTTISLLVIICTISAFLNTDYVANMISVCSLSLVGAMQFESFNHCVSYYYTSTMCTNNMRLLGESVASLNKNKILFYSFVIITFLLGVICGQLLGKCIGLYSILIASGIYLILFFIQAFSKQS